MKKFKPFPSHDFKIDCGSDPEVRKWLHENGCRWSSGFALVDHHCINERFLIIEGRHVVYDNSEYDFSYRVHQHFDPYLQEPTTTPRPHAELIKQWADDDSLVIETRPKGSDEWGTTHSPAWCEEFSYRIKPKTVTKSLYVRLSSVDSSNITNYSYFSKDEVPEGWLKVENSEKEFEV